MIRCFYHSADLDGHCSGAIVKYRFPDAVMYPINYGDAFPWDEIQPEDEIYMVDFALQPFQEMIRLFNLEEDVTIHWIDHHSQVLEDFKTYLTLDEVAPVCGKWDTRKAACELTWEYLFPDKPVPLAVKLLSLYYSWTYQGHELEEMVLPFQIGLRMEGLDPFEPNWSDGAHLGWRCFFGDESLLNLYSLGQSKEGVQRQFIKSFVDEGRLLLHYDAKLKTDYAKTYAFETLLPYVPDDLDDTIENRRNLFAIAVNLGHTNSKVFDSVWRKECTRCYGLGETDMKGNKIYCPDCDDYGYIEPYDVMVPFVRRKDRLWNVSLYSTKPEIDCGAIAKSFGGGGHKGAAGFQCDKLPFEI